MATLAGVETLAAGDSLKVFAGTFNVLDTATLIAGDQVYTLGAEGRLHCLEFQTGRKVWDRSLNSDYHVRKGLPLAEVERWLGPYLNYDPAKEPAVASA